MLLLYFDLGVFGTLGDKFPPFLSHKKVKKAVFFIKIARFNLDVTLTSWESILSLSEPHHPEVSALNWLPEETVPPFF